MLRRIKGRVCPDCRNMSNKINVINRYETQGHFHSFVLDSPRKKDLTSRVIAPILFSTGTVWRSTCKELCGEHWIHLKQRKQHSEQQTDDWLAAQSEALPLHSVVMKEKGWTQRWTWEHPSDDSCHTDLSDGVVANMALQHAKIFYVFEACSLSANIFRKILRSHDNPQWEIQLDQAIHMTTKANANLS